MVIISGVPIFRIFTIFLAYLRLNKTYAWHMLCQKKPIPGISYVRQNLFLAYMYVMLYKTTYGILIVVKICKTRCFPSKMKI